MDTVFWIVIAAVAVLVVALLAAWSYAKSRRRTALRDQFGREYDRTVDSAGSRRKAERELAEREKAHESLDIQPLSEAAREADRIVRSVLDDRGYPNDDFDTQAAAVSVDHPNVVARYRHGHEMLHGNGDRKGKTKGADNEERTENLRKAMVDFRAVFEQLVEPQAEFAER